MATERPKHNDEVPPVPRGRFPKDLSAKQRMARKLRIKKGWEQYAKREIAPLGAKDVNQTDSYGDKPTFAAKPNTEKGLQISVSIWFQVDVDST